MEQRAFQDLGGMFPRPGKALKAILVLVALLSITGWIVVNWMPGGAAGMEIFSYVACSRAGLFEASIPRVWTLFTAGFFTTPGGTGAAQDLFFTLIGLYFFSPELEKRWGPKRFLRIMATSVIVGFALAIAMDKLTPAHLAIFHPPMMWGAGAAMTATIVAWSRQNADAQVRLFFVLPMKGSWFFWIAIAYAVAGVLAWDQQNSAGVIAPFGGILTGLALGGTPSFARSVYLRAKLALLKKQAGGPPDRPSSPRPARSTRSGGPPLRVVYGGLEDELKKRKPPKDKRYLN